MFGYKETQVIAMYLDGRTPKGVNPEMIPHIVQSILNKIDNINIADLRKGKHKNNQQ